MWDSIDRIIALVHVLIIFFIPYNVDRPSRRVPYVTYGLMGLNIFLFFTTVFISNVNLPADRIVGRQEAAKILNQAASADKTLQGQIDALKEINPDLVKDGLVTFEINEDADAEKQGLLGKGPKAMARAALHNKATELEYKKVDTEDGYQKAWQVEYMDSSYVLTPHYSALEWFAYRPGEQSVLGKLLGLVGSMFLHGGFSHIIFNMLFLWVFGRAVEDSLGPYIYLGAYLLCGLAATLLYHIMTQQFTPDQMMIPSFGASGAIAGVIGLFAPRFYRTPIRVFYLTVLAFVVTLVTMGTVGLLLLFLTHDLGATITLLAIALLVGFYYFGRVWAWGTTKIPAIWFIGFYIGISDIYPSIKSLISGDSIGDGVAHWAHIGGLCFGVLYAFLIGSQNEGKQEFMLEDAQKAFDNGDMAGAVTFAQNILEREPANPFAYEIIGKSFIRENNENDSLDNLELAISNYIRIGERGHAASAYLVATEKYPRFILQPSSQLAVGNQLAKNFDYKNAAETLVKIPYTFPDAPEGEVALLRSSQLYLQHLNQPQTAQQLLTFFWQKYPESQWMPQAERAWKMSQHQMSIPDESELVEEVVPDPTPQEPLRVRTQAVAPILELESDQGQPPQGGLPTKTKAPRV